MSLTIQPSLAPHAARKLPLGLLPAALIVGLLLLPARLSRAEDRTGAPTSQSDTNCAVPAGWLQVPGHEVVLDLRSEGLSFGCRRDAGEFLLSILNLLLQAGYTVRLSDGFLEDEIVYYSLNQEREKPQAMSSGILACLRQARNAHLLDWDCFKSVSRSSGDMLAGARHLPWMSPPVHSDAVGLAGVGVTNVPQLHLRVHWTGRPIHKAVQISRMHSALPGESALLMNEDTLWSFSADMRLQNGEQVVFEKDYPQEPPRKEYVGASDTPVERAIQTILQDLDTGLKPKPEPPAQPKGKKQHKAKSAKAVSP